MAMDEPPPRLAIIDATTVYDGFFFALHLVGSDDYKFYGDLGFALLIWGLGKNV
jgi:hypothetical protein